MKVQRMIFLKQKMVFFGCLAAIFLTASFPECAFGESSWTLEFVGDFDSYSSGGSIDVVLKITAGDVFRGVTASINLPYGWSVSSGPSMYRSDEVSESSAVGWTIYGGSKESLGEITATVTSIDPAKSETVKLSQAGELPPVNPITSAPSIPQAVQDGAAEPSQEEPAPHKPSLFNFTRVKESIKNLFSREKTCEQVVTYARSEATGECIEHSTPCDVPRGWELVSSCYMELPQPSEGDGEKQDTVSRVLRALYYIVIVLVAIFLIIVAVSAYRMMCYNKKEEIDKKRYSFE